MAEAGKRRGNSSGQRSGRIGPRPYWVLLVSVAVRAVHQVGAAMVLASCLLGDGVLTLDRYFVVAAVSGVLLVGSEWLRHRQLYREVAGLTTLLKCLILAAVVHGLVPAVPWLPVAFVAACLAAHAPREIRHHLLP